MSLEAVPTGDAEGAAAEIETALGAGSSASDILHKAYIPAMTEVGRLFAAGERVVPEMLIAAGDAKGDHRGSPRNPGLDVEEWYIRTVTRQDYIYEVFDRQCEIALENLAKGAYGHYPLSRKECTYELKRKSTHRIGPQTGGPGAGHQPVHS